MDIIEQFEYPLPILKTDIEKIVIETSNVQRGGFTVVNDGGGTLSGQIMSNTPSLTFNLQNFTGNEVRIDYEFINTVYKKGDTLQSSVVLMSNGGEKNIPVIIKIIPSAIVTKENVKLVDVKDYLAYTKKYPLQSRQLFMSNEFYMWLLGIGYEYTDIYEHLIKDPNKERAQENFFVLGKVKNKPVLSVPQDKIYLELDYYQNDMVSGRFAVKKTGWGFIDCALSVENGSTWLKLDRYRISQSDFNAEDLLYVTYYADASIIKEKLVTDRVIFSDGPNLQVKVKRKPLITMDISNEYFGFEDSGKLILRNNSGKDMFVDVSARDSYIKFASKKYPVGKYTEIPFTIKLSAIGMAQLGFKKQPTLSTEIGLRCVFGDKVIKRTFPVTLGNVF